MNATPCQEFIRGFIGNWKGTAYRDNMEVNSVFEVVSNNFTPQQRDLLKRQQRGGPTTQRAIQEQQMEDSKKQQQNARNGSSSSSSSPSSVLTHTTSRHPDCEAQRLDHNGLLQCTGPRQVEWMLQHSFGGNVETVTGEVAADGQSAVLKSASAEATGHPAQLAATEYRIQHVEAQEMMWYCYRAFRDKPAALTLQHRIQFLPNVQGSNRNMI